MNNWLGGDLGHKPSVFEKAKSEYSPLGMSLSKTIKSVDDAKKPAKNNTNLRFGSWSFEAEKFKRIPSLD